MLEPLFALHCLEELIPLNYHFAIDQGTLQLKLKLWPYLLRSPLTSLSSLRSLRIAVSDASIIPGEAYVSHSPQHFIPA